MANVWLHTPTEGDNPRGSLPTFPCVDPTGQLPHPPNKRANAVELLPVFLQCAEHGLRLTTHTLPLLLSCTQQVDYLTSLCS